MPASSACECWIVRFGRSDTDLSIHHRKGVGGGGFLQFEYKSCFALADQIKEVEQVITH